MWKMFLLETAASTWDDMHIVIAEHARVVTAQPERERRQAAASGGKRRQAAASTSRRTATRATVSQSFSSPCSAHTEGDGHAASSAAACAGGTIQLRGRDGGSVVGGSIQSAPSGPGGILAVLVQPCCITWQAEAGHAL